MPSPVSTTPTDFVLGAVKVGKAVSSAHLVRIASECSFLGLHNLQLQHLQIKTLFGRLARLNTTLKNTSVFGEICRLP